MLAIKEYFESFYSMLKRMFDESGILSNNIIIGSVREQIANQMLTFFPESKESGWILDRAGNQTGQIDLMLVLNKALRIPGYAFGESVTNGFFANHVCAAFEIKSGIASKIGEIMKKTWECHRLEGGLSTHPRTYETIDGENLYFHFESGLPIFVIGNNGFNDAGKYLEHFGDFGKLTYSVNREDITGPTTVSQVIPELLLDFTKDTLLVKNSLHPEIIEHYFSPHTESIKNDYFTFFPNLDGGRTLVAMLYYLDVIRQELSLTQQFKGTPLLEVFRSEQNTNGDDLS
jgi:hypothetical protein